MTHGPHDRLLVMELDPHPKAYAIHQSSAQSMPQWGERQSSKRSETSMRRSSGMSSARRSLARRPTPWLLPSGALSKRLSSRWPEMSTRGGRPRGSRPAGP